MNSAALVPRWHSSACLFVSSQESTSHATFPAQGQHVVSLALRYAFFETEDVEPRNFERDGDVIMLKKANAFRHSRIVRSVRDFLTGLGLFALILTGSSYLPAREATSRLPIFTSRAHASPAYEYTQINNVFAARADSKAATVTAQPGKERHHMVILALVFASLVAFNLAFLRHLRRVYASPR